MAGATPMATQCKSSCTDAEPTPGYAASNSEGSQLTGTDQNASKFTPFKYRAVIQEFTLGRKILKRKFKANSDLNEVFSIQIQLTYSRPQRYTLPLMIQNNLLATCFLALLATENGEDPTLSSAQGHQIKCSSRRRISSRIIKAPPESWTRKLMMYCGYSKFT